MKALLTLVILLLLTLHLHLWLGARKTSEAAPAAAVEEGPRPIMLEESTLRSMVREEVARALGSSGLSEIDVEAMGRRIKEHFREQVRGALASEYVGESPNLRQRTETAITQAHVLLVSELALRAQAQAHFLPASR